jgi:hypothetical protein
MTEKRIIHKGLEERWNKFSLAEQLGNVGSDVERMISWRNKGNMEMAQGAFERTLELLDFTIADSKNRGRLKEIVRIRFLIVDFFMYDNEFGTTDTWLQHYFFEFAYAAALAKGK